MALSFDPQEDLAAPYIARGARPAVAILREQGVNSQVETAAVFERAGFTPHDVHMTDLLAGRRTLAEFKGLVACGGFSYGDVLGAGEGWAKSILFHEAVREEFAALLRARRHLCPRHLQRLPDVRGPEEHHPRDRALAAVREQPQRAVRGALLAGGGAAVALGAVRRGWRARCCRSRWRTARGARSSATAAAAAACAASGLVSLRYINADRSVATTYPANPSGTPFGIAALANTDGRVTITMPHPERSFRYRAEFMAPARCGRVQRLDAPVPQRAPLRRLRCFSSRR